MRDYRWTLAHLQLYIKAHCPFKWANKQTDLCSSGLSWPRRCGSRLIPQLWSCCRLVCRSRWCLWTRRTGRSLDRSNLQPGSRPAAQTRDQVCAHCPGNKSDPSQQTVCSGRIIIPEPSLPLYTDDSQKRVCLRCCCSDAAEEELRPFTHQHGLLIVNRLSLIGWNSQCEFLRLFSLNLKI